MKKPVVIDTSVMIAALIGEAGPAREILRRCLKGQYIPLMGNALFAEYEDVASRPDILNRCPISPDEIRELLNAFYSVSKWVPVYFLWRPNLSDEGDNHIVELAVAGHADWLVTENIRDFKRAELRFPELRFMTPAQLLKGERDGNTNN